MRLVCSSPMARKRSNQKVLWSKLSSIADNTILVQSSTVNLFPMPLELPRHCSPGRLSAFAIALPQFAACENGRLTKHRSQEQSIHRPDLLYNPLSIHPSPPTDTCHVDNAPHIPCPNHTFVLCGYCVGFLIGCGINPTLKGYTESLRAWKWKKGRRRGRGKGGAVRSFATRKWFSGAQLVDIRGGGWIVCVGGEGGKSYAQSLLVPINTGITSEPR